MHTVIISGSHRKTSQSDKVTKFLSQRITTLNSGDTVETLSLAGNPLPLWDESIWQGNPEWKTRWQPYSDALTRADSLIVISPEWGGMVPPGLKNFFLLCNPREVGHKPALIVSVSAGPGGAYPVSELRTSSYKNNKVCYLPEHLIIRYVEGVLAPEESVPKSKEDEYLRKRADYSLTMLRAYGTALKPMRESTPELYTKEFTFGM